MAREKEEEESMELIQKAIHQLIEEKEKDHTSLPISTNVDGIQDAEDHQRSLSQLLSQLEALKAAKELDGSSIVKDSKDSDIEELGPQEAHVKDLKTLEADVAEVLAELKIVKRQNSITHWLLSIMIVGSVIWRLSEVSLFLTVKDKLSNPLKSVGNLITSSFRGAVREVEIATESPPLPNIQMPPLPHLDLQSLHFDGGDK